MAERGGSYVMAGLRPATRKSDHAVGAWSRKSEYPASPLSPRNNFGSVPRQTQRYAAERLLDALRKHTSMLPVEKTHVHSIDEVLALGASAVFGLHEEVQEQEREVVRLRNELAAAYRASAIAAADDINAARREADNEKDRCAAEARSFAAREADLESAVLSAHSQLSEEQRTRGGLQELLAKTRAGVKLLEQRLELTREAARQVLNSLPPSASEESAEADRLVRVAAGEMVPEHDGVDEMGLLARALDRSMRCSERTRNSEAEAALVRAELDAERGAHKVVQEELRTVIEAQKAGADERASLRTELAECLEAKEKAEEAARRFQTLLQAQQQQLETHHQLLQQQQQQQRPPPPPSQPRAPTPPPPTPTPLPPWQQQSTSAPAWTPRSVTPSPRVSPSSRSSVVAPPPTIISDSSVAVAAAAVDQLEAAVRETAAMTALLRGDRQA